MPPPPPPHPRPQETGASNWVLCRNRCGVGIFNSCDLELNSGRSADGFPSFFLYFSCRRTQSAAFYGHEVGEWWRSRPSPLLPVNPRKSWGGGACPRPRGPAGLQLCPLPPSPQLGLAGRGRTWEGCCHRVAAAAFEGLQWTGQGTGQPCALAVEPRDWKGQRACPILGKR